MDDTDLSENLFSVMRQSSQLPCWWWLAKQFSFPGQDPGFIKPSWGKAEIWNYFPIAVEFQDWGWRIIMVPNMPFPIVCGRTFLIGYFKSPFHFVSVDNISNSNYWYQVTGPWNLCKSERFHYLKTVGFLSQTGTACTILFLSSSHSSHLSRKPLSRGW